MYWHPLLLTIISVQVVALFLVLAAGITAFRAALDWQPAFADSRQLSLEAAVESASILGRTAFWLYLFVAFLLVFGIANVFHEDLPGAMCGTGVCQAMAGESVKLLLFIGSLLFVMQLWYEMDRLNRKQVDTPLTEVNARVFLIIPPVAILTLMQTYHAFAGIEPHRPVDCCAVVYDQFHSLQQASDIAGVADAWWMAAFILLSILLLGLSLVFYASGAVNRKARTLLPIVCWMWLPVAALTLVNILSAYQYGVLHHHCPWCLFLPEHYVVGYPLYGALGLIGLEGLLLFSLPRLAGINPQADRYVLLRCRQAVKRIRIAEIVFLIITLAPVIGWRLRFGVWMSG